MDKQIQDIHYEDTLSNMEYVIRKVEIVYINANKDFIEIYYRKLHLEEVRILVLPKMRGTKLIID